jgi:hypothetical protein
MKQRPNGTRECLIYEKIRRLSIVIGTILIGLGFIIEGSVPIFRMIVLGQVLWGIGYTFTSGATQAWSLTRFQSKQPRSRRTRPVLRQRRYGTQLTNLFPVSRVGGGSAGFLDA